jgi:hypothetical protein
MDKVRNLTANFSEGDGNGRELKDQMYLLPLIV